MCMLLGLCWPEIPSAPSSMPSGIWHRDPAKPLRGRSEEYPRTACGCPAKERRATEERTASNATSSSGSRPDRCLTSPVQDPGWYALLLRRVHRSPACQCTLASPQRLAFKVKPHAAAHTRSQARACSQSACRGCQNLECTCACLVAAILAVPELPTCCDHIRPGP